MTDRHYDNLLQKIKNELEDIQKDRTLTTDDQAFGFWVAERIFNVDPTDAEIGVAGHENGIDILSVDSQKNEVIITQVKWSSTLDHKMNTDEIDKLSNSPQYLYDESVVGNSTFHQRKKEFREIINGDQEYAIHLQLVLAGTFSKDQELKMNSLKKLQKIPLGRKSIKITFSYMAKSGLYDVIYHPETPDISFNFEKHMEFTNGTRRDLFTIISGKEIVEKLTEENYITLFEFNPRFYLGMNERDDANINSGIKKTASGNDSENFLEYNNGITCVCDSYELNDNKIIIKNLKIVNGCQTVVSLGNADAVRDNVTVLCKLYEIDSGESGDELKRNISKFTNSQNAITIRDLASDHPKQKEIQEYIANNFKRFFWEKKSGERRFYQNDDIWQRKYKPQSLRIIDNLSAAKIAYSWHNETPYEAVMLKETEIFDSKDEKFAKIWNDIPTSEIVLSWIMHEILKKAISYIKKTENQPNLESYIGTYPYDANNVINLMNSKYSQYTCLSLVHNFLKKHPKHEEIKNKIITIMSPETGGTFPPEHKDIMPILFFMLQYLTLNFCDLHFDGKSVSDDQTREIKLIFEDPLHYGNLLTKVKSHDKMLDGGITEKLNRLFEKLIES